MTEGELRHEFEKLMDDAEIKWETTYDSHDLEPSLLAILNFFKDNVEFREFLERLLVEIIVDGARWRVSLEMIEFCMHELRWPRVKSTAKEVLSNAQDPRIRYALWRIPDAYSDDWNGREFYDYYS